MAAACKDPDTAIAVVVDSDLAIGSELTTIRVRVFELESGKVQRLQDFPLTSRGGEKARYTVPLRFRLAQRNDKAVEFRLVVTGRGSIEEGGEETDIAEQETIASFRPHATRRMSVFLARACLGKLCRDEAGDLTCNASNGLCEAVGVQEDSVPDAGGDDVPAGLDGGTEEDSGPRMHGDCAAEGDWTCECAEGGAECGDDVCAALQCQHGAQCRAGGSSASCDCAGTGYMGPTCENDVNECADLAATCGAGATGCSNTDGGYTCSCGGSYVLDADLRGCHPRAWGTPQLIVSDAGDALYPAVAMDSSGNAVLVWAQGEGTLTDIWASHYAIGGDWAKPVLIDNDSHGAGGPDVAMDGVGNATAVWSQSESNGANSIWANRCSMGNWGTPTLVKGADGSGAGRPLVASGGSGDATAIWWQADRGHPKPWANRYRSKTGWGPAVQLDTSAGDANSYALAMDWDDAVAVWFLAGGDRNGLWSSLGSSGAWTAATPLVAADALYVTSPAIAMYGQNAVVVWSQSSNNGPASIWASRRTFGDAWDTPVLVEADDSGTAKSPTVTLDGSGNAVAIWSQSDGTFDNILASRRVKNAADGWGAPVALESNPGDAREPAAVVDGLGNVVVAWLQWDGMRTNVWANRYTAGDGWGMASLVEANNAGDAFFVLVAGDDAGNVVVVWFQSDGARKDLWAVHFE